MKLATIECNNTGHFANERGHWAFQFGDDTKRWFAIGNKTLAAARAEAMTEAAARFATSIRVVARLDYRMQKGH